MIPSKNYYIKKFLYNGNGMQNFERTRNWPYIHRINMKAMIQIQNVQIQKEWKNQFFI